MIECLWVINEHRYPWCMGIGMGTGELNCNGTDWYKVRAWLLELPYTLQDGID